MYSALMGFALFMYTLLLFGYYYYYCFALITVCLSWSGGSHDNRKLFAITWIKQVSDNIPGRRGIIILFATKSMKLFRSCFLQPFQSMELFLMYITPIVCFLILLGYIACVLYLLYVYVCVVHTVRKDTTEHMMRCNLQHSNKWLYY